MATTKSMLDRQLAMGIRPHAYLLWGNDEAGKESAFQHIIAPYISGDYRIHPNVFEVSVPEGETSISIETVRRIRARALETPFDISGGEARNIIIIRDIDAITYPGISVLLKILEEPPERTMFVAFTRRYHAIFPTLKSRFSSFRFFAIPDVSISATHDIARAVSEMTKRAENGTVKEYVEERIVAAERALRSHLGKPEMGTLVHSLDSILVAHRAFLTDPSINKRLVGEYIAMLS